MKAVQVSFSAEDAEKSKEEKSALLDAEIERFNQFMISFPDFRAQGPLLPQERILLKTYLVHKINGNIDRGSADGTTES